MNIRRAGLLAASLLLLSCTVSAGLPMAVNGQPLPSLAPMLERTTPAVAGASGDGFRQAALPAARAATRGANNNWKG